MESGRGGERRYIQREQTEAADCCQKQNLKVKEGRENCCPKILHPEKYLSKTKAK